MDKGIEARISLIVTGEQMGAEEISAAIGLQPTTRWNKGDLINRLPPIRVEQSEWRHTIPLSKPIGHDADMDDFLEYLISRKSAIKQMTSAGMSVALRLYVQSDAVQMVYQLMPGTLRSLADLGMMLEVSSLSWGDMDM